MKIRISESCQKLHQNRRIGDFWGRCSWFEFSKWVHSQQLPRYDLSKLSPMRTFSQKIYQPMEPGIVWAWPGLYNFNFYSNIRLPWYSHGLRLRPFYFVHITIWEVRMSSVSFWDIWKSPFSIFYEPFSSLRHYILIQICADFSFLLNSFDQVKSRKLFRSGRNLHVLYWTPSLWARAILDRMVLFHDPKDLGTRLKKPSSKRMISWAGATVEFFAW